MRLPKKDQNLIAEAYETVQQPTKNSETFNQNRIGNQLDIKLSNGGYKLVDSWQFNRNGFTVYTNNKYTALVNFADNQFKGAIVSEDKKAAKNWLYNQPADLQQAHDLVEYSSEIITDVPTLFRYLEPDQSDY
jgi:hypothetical protein